MGEPFSAFAADPSDRFPSVAFIRSADERGRMSEIEIEYCVPCGFLSRASDLAETLLATFGEDLDRVSLVTGDAGVFVVRVDGVVVFDKSTDAYDVDDVVRSVRDAI